MRRGNGVKRPALLRRFPTVRGRAVASSPILAGRERERYPALAEDLTYADETVGSAFAESDRNALLAQNRYRRQQVTVILGSVLLSALGGLQAALPDARWPGLALALVGFALVAVGRAAGELNTFNTFLRERLQAERLRSAYFRFLSRTGRYSFEDRRTALRRVVVAVKKGEEA